MKTNSSSRETKSVCPSEPASEFLHLLVKIVCCLHLLLFCFVFHPFLLPSLCWMVGGFSFFFFSVVVVVVVGVGVGGVVVVHSWGISDVSPLSGISGL